MRTLATATAFVSLVCAVALADGLAAHAEDWAARTLVLLFLAGLLAGALAAIATLAARRRRSPVGRATLALVAAAVVVQLATLSWTRSVHVRALGFRAVRAVYTLGMARDLPGWPPESR